MKKYFLLCIIVILFIAISALSNQVRIHVIPHTHDDAGWIWTFAQYYYKTGGSSASVHKILDNMVLSLYDNSDRTFIYVELAYFTKWYTSQTEETKLKVKALLHEGRFEFINGGYVMHDEATTYYQDIIDQMRIGLLFLKEEFDYVPTIGWFIDPFGHSAANAYLLSKMNFKKIVFVRIDQKEKEQRKKTKTLEFYYKPFGQIDAGSKIFTHVTYDHYCNPKGMENFISDKELNLTESEIKKRSDIIYEELKKINSGYRHEEVMMMYGCDFSHNERSANFKNIEKIMDYINTNYSDMKMVYSTPSKYFNSILEKVKDWPEYSNYDFFPYAEYPYSYWTGYFSSRPYLKGLVRETGQYLLISSRFMMEFLLNSLQSSSGIFNYPSSIYIRFNESQRNQFSLREKLAICQHHDAVSGTAKELVSEDYIAMLDDSITKVKDSMGNILQTHNTQICIFNPTVHIECQSFLLSNFNDIKILYIFNPTLEGDYPVSFDYVDSKLRIYDEENKIVPSNIVCFSNAIVEKFKCRINFTIKFSKTKSFYKIILKKTRYPANLEGTKLSDFNNIELSHSFISFDNKTLKFSYRGNKEGDEEKEYNFSLKHGYYDAYKGIKSDIRPESVNPSGAYIFSPAEENPIEYSINYEKSFIFHRKDFLQVTLRFEHSYLHVKVIGENMMEIETVWDSIDEAEKQKGGKEYVLLLSSNIKNKVKLPNADFQPEFWTDSNGMKLVRRFKDFRQGWDYQVTEKVAANFYPVNYMASMRDRADYLYDTSDYKGLSNSDRVLSLINDRSQSIGAMREGEFVVLINRHSQLDDWKGLEEPLFEISSSKYLQVKHLLVFGNKFDKILARNYFNNKPAYFAFLDKSTQNGQNISSEFDNSFLSKLIEYSSNITINLHIVDESKVFIQFINLLDPYFSGNNNLAEDSYKFKNVLGIDYTIDEYNLGGNIKLSKHFKAFLKEPILIILKEQSYSLAPQDIKLFLLKFKS